MNKLDEAIKSLELAEKIYHENFENNTPQAVLIILQAARPTLKAIHDNLTKWSD